MTLHLTPAMVEGAYRYFCTTPPFVRYRMPHADDIEFAIVNDPGVHGWYQRRPDGGHKIAASIACIGYTITLMQTTAHEMLHIYQAVSGLETGAEHNADFKRRAGIVSRYHGFDPRLF